MSPTEKRFLKLPCLLFLFLSGVRLFRSRDHDDLALLQRVRMSVFNTDASRCWAVGRSGNRDSKKDHAQGDCSNTRTVYCWRYRALPEGNLGDVCGFTLRKIGEVDFTLLRSGLKIEWSELSPKFADDALVSCEDIAVAWNLEAKTVRNHYRKAWGKPVAKRGRHDVWRFGTIKTIVMQQKSEEE